MSEDQDRSFQNRKPMFQAPKHAQIVPIVNMSERNARIEAERDMSQAQKVSAEENERRAAERKAQKRAEAKSKRKDSKESKAREPSDKSSLAFRGMMYATDGNHENVSLVLKTDRDPDGYTPAAASAKLLGILREYDRYSHVRIEQGCFLVVHFRTKDGDKAEIHWYLSEDKATERGQKEMSENDAVRFTISQVCTKREVLLRDRVPGRDSVVPSRKRPVHWTRKTKAGWKMRARQDHARFSAG